MAWAIAPLFINILLGYNTHLYILSFAGADAASILYQLQKVLQQLLVLGEVQWKVVSWTILSGASLLDCLFLLGIFERAAPGSVTTATVAWVFLMAISIKIRISLFRYDWIRVLFGPVSLGWQCSSVSAIYKEITVQLSLGYGSRIYLNNFKKNSPLGAILTSISSSAPANTNKLWVLSSTQTRWIGCNTQYVK